MASWRLGFRCMAGAISLALAGCGVNSVQTPGPAGPQGPRGLDAGSDLPGTVVTVVSVNDDVPVTPGDTTAVRFKLETDDGDPINAEELDRFSAYISGPTNNYQYVIPPEGDMDRIAAVGDGEYTYTFSVLFPSVFAPPPGDSDAFGPEDRELTGTAISDGTYTVGLEARRTFMIEGEALRDAGDAAFDFSVGSAPVLHREVVIQANCNRCHEQLTLHGENRFSVTNCVLCHINGAEDLESEDPAKQTEGLTIQFANMIHRIHRGFELPTVAATENSSDPFRYEVIGFGGSVHDFSDVEFPFLPGGTGFNEQVRNCGACHDGAADGDRAYENPRRSTCSGCHDDIDWNAGTMLDQSNPDVAAGTLTKDQLSDPAFRAFFAGGLLQHTFADGTCMECHNPDSPTLSVAVNHRPPLSNEDNTLGLSVDVQAVARSGGGVLQPGDFPVIRFNILDRDGRSVDIADVASVNVVISGPVENYQRIIPSNGTTLSIKGAGGVPDNGTGPFTYTSAEAIPSTYPAPFNDSTAFDFDGGWGELNGRTLVNGSYTAYVYATQTFEVNGTTYREASQPGLLDFRVGSGGAVTSYAGTVIDATCNACHGDLAFHGNNRKGVAGCVVCHTAGAEDRANPVAGQSQDSAADTIDFKVMIHKIHNGRNLDVVAMGGAYDIVGFASGQPSDTGNVSDFSTGVLPTMPGEAKDCTACHATDAWMSPSERSDRNTWKIACTSCHDSEGTRVHVELNTLGVGQEACSTCHGDGRAFSIEKVHETP